MSAIPAQNGGGFEGHATIDSASLKMVQALPHLADYVDGNLLPSVANPLKSNRHFHPIEGFFVTETDMVMYTSAVDLAAAETENQILYHAAGPRAAIRFRPEEVSAAIVSCGGLCPGLNTVIRELVNGLWYQYGVRDIQGIKSGFRGFYASEPVALTPKAVDHCHRRGGTVLETSRGGFDLGRIVDAIEARRFNQVYVIGGDGTMRAAVEMFGELKRRRLPISVVGIPKTAENDLGIIDRSFGFETAVEVAQNAIDAAHVEAQSATNGVGLVKLMGRTSGHIALHSTLSSRDVDCCLIPEDPFYLDGEGGLFEFVDQRLAENGHFVLVVAEGAGQDLIPRPPAATEDEENEEEEEEEGNPEYTDVGPWLCEELKLWWKRKHPGELFTVKYIDPTYTIRAVPGNATDNLFCTLLSQSAIHGAMAGYTGFVAGPVNGNYAYIPMDQVAAAQNLVNTNDQKYAWVRSVTNQPDFSRTAQGGKRRSAKVEALRKEIKATLHPSFFHVY